MRQKLSRAAAIASSNVTPHLSSCAWWIVFTEIGEDVDEFETWGLRSSSGPSWRVAHAMAYDSARGVTVLFGGSGNSGPVRDTWEWDGTTWALRSNSGPSPRYSHAMAYDSDTTEVVHRDIVLHCRDAVLTGNGGHGNVIENAGSRVRKR